MISTKVKSFIEQAFKFGIVGVLNTALTAATIFILMHVFSVVYTVSNAVGYILGFINSLVLNKLWTFKSKGSLMKEIVVFSVVFLVCYVLQLVFLVLLKERLGVEVDPAQLIGMVFYTVINFFGHKYFTFKNA